MGTRQSLLSVVLGLDNKAFSKGMQQSLRKLDQFEKTATRTGKNLSLRLTAPLLALGGVATKTFVDFERQLAKVKAISGATGAEFEALKQNALDLGSSTVFAASEVAALQEEFAKLGFNSGEIINATEDTLALAQAFGIELNDAATVVGTTLNQFNLGAEESGRVADVMAASFANSALDATKFSEAMKSAGPVANKLGLSLEETTAALGILANSGVDGSLAGNALKRTFSELQKEGPKVTETFRALLKNELSFSEATELLGDRAAVLGTILGGQADEVDKLTDSLNNSEGTARGFAAEIDNTLGGSLASLRSALEGAAIEIGESLAPAIKSAADFVKDLAKKFTELSPETKETIIRIAGLAAAIGPAILVAGKMAGAVAGITRAVKALSLAAKANPIGLIVAAAAAALPIIKAIAETVADLSDNSTAAQKSARALNLEISKEVGQAQNLFGALQRTIAAGTDRKDAIDKLNGVYPDLLKNYDLEKISQEDLVQAYEDVKLAVSQAAIEKFKANKVAGAETAQADANFRAIERINEAYGDSFVNAGKAQGEFFKLSEQVKTGEISAVAAARAFSDFNDSLGVQRLSGVSQFREIEQSIKAVEQATQVADAAVSQLFSDVPIGPEPFIPDPTDPDKPSPGGGEPTLSVLRQPVILEPIAKIGLDEVVEPELLQPVQLEVRPVGILETTAQLEAQAAQTQANRSALSGMFKESGAAAQKMAENQEILAAAGMAAADGVGALFDNIAANAGLAENSIASIALKTIGAALSASLAQAVMLAFSPTPDNVATGGIAGAAKAAGLTALITGLFSAIPAFAQGGMVTGPTLAMVGDNASGKELILPLEKAQKFFNGGNVNVSGRLQGDVIHLAGERGNKQRGR